MGASIFCLHRVFWGNLLHLTIPDRDYDYNNYTVIQYTGIASFVLTITAARIESVAV